MRSGKQNSMILKVISYCQRWSIMSSDLMKTRLLFHFLLLDGFVTASLIQRPSMQLLMLSAKLRGAEYHVLFLVLFGGHLNPQPLT